MAGEKTEKATPKRKQDERKMGNVFQSHEVVMVAGLLASFYGLKLLGPFTLQTLETSVAQFFLLAGEFEEISIQECRQLFIDGFIIFVKAALPLLLISGLVAVILTLAQTKLLFSMKSLAFKANRLNPLSGLKKIISLRGMVEMLKAVSKI